MTFTEKGVGARAIERLILHKDEDVNSLFHTKIEINY